MLPALLLILYAPVVLAQLEPPEPVVTCAATSCSVGRECRIVFNKKTGVVRPSCEKPCDIPKDAGSERCGTSGLPVLELVKDTKEVRKLQVYTHGNSCPAPGLVFKDGVCCFDTEKVGQCVKPGDFGICVLNCASDNDCPGSQKCCPTGCSGSFTCSDPVSEITCLTAKCSKGFTCVDTPNGPECLPTTKPGSCPAFRCPIPEHPDCTNACEVDADCKGTDKCCWGCSGCNSCFATSPPLSCATVLCQKGTTCKETPSGPSCVPILKPGVCPLFPCPAPRDDQPEPACRNECENDSDCKGDDKCCRGCDRCKTCVYPRPPLTCDNVDCRPGQVCIMQQVVCVTSPCFPVPTCIGTDPKPGECPIPQPGQVSTCDFRCQYDEECPLQEKCCKTACGGTGCREPQLDLTCANVLCVVNTICREVLDRTTGVVSPSCIESPFIGQNDKVCLPGTPLFVREADGDTMQAFCGRGLGRVDCPRGYECRIAPDDRYALCCPVVTDPCFLPPDTGPCEALIPRYYFDANRRRCKIFIYGGCQGNANRFATRRECKKSCAHVKCPATYAGVAKPGCRKTNECKFSDRKPKKCPAGKTCCDTPCGRRCLAPESRP